MNFQFYLEKLKASESFKKFIEENPDAFACSGFFIIDKEGKDNKSHFDFYLPKQKKMFSFQLEEGIKLVPIEMIGEKIPEKISLNLNFDFKNIEKIIEEKMQAEEIRNKIQKILLSLQKIDGKDFFVGTVFISGLGMLKIAIDLKEMKITEFEKKSFFDMLKIKKK